MRAVRYRVDWHFVWNFVAVAILLLTVACGIALHAGWPMEKRLKPAVLDAGPDETG